MKRFSVLMCVLAVLFSAMMSYAQRERCQGCRGQACSSGSRGENEERGLDLQKRRAELEFQQAKREIALEKMRRGLNPEKRHPKFGPRSRQHHWLESGLKRSSGCPMTRGGCHKIAFPFIFLMIVVNILLAVWVYKDIRKRNSDSGIWIVIALLTGLFGTAVYAIVRIGDKKK